MLANKFDLSRVSFIDPQFLGMDKTGFYQIFSFSNIARK
jgi:hypothetical protein